MMPSSVEQIPTELIALVPTQLRPRFQQLWADSSRLRTFVKDYSLTIQRKFREAAELQDADDVFAELETAARLLSKQSFGVVYEPHGRAGVDFQVGYSEGDFNVETKRIRQTQATTMLDECLARMISAIREIPSQLGVLIECDAIGVDPAFVGRLRDDLDVVILHACAGVNALNGKLKDGATETITFDAFPGLRLLVAHIPEKDPDSPTANIGGVSPLLYTQKEPRKYADRILDAVKQLRKGIPNVLFLWSDSITHEAEDLNFAVQEIEQSIRDNEDVVFAKRGFKDTADFAERLRLMTAVVAISQESRGAGVARDNVVWLHPRPETPLCGSVIGWLHEF
jgi:hypothetical protein